MSYSDWRLRSVSRSHGYCDGTHDCSRSKYWILRVKLVYRSIRRIRYPPVWYIIDGIPSWGFGTLRFPAFLRRINNTRQNKNILWRRSIFETNGYYWVRGIDGFSQRTINGKPPTNTVIPNGGQTFPSSITSSWSEVKTGTYSLPRVDNQGCHKRSDGRPSWILFFIRLHLQGCVRPAIEFGFDVLRGYVIVLTTDPEEDAWRPSVRRIRTHSIGYRPRLTQMHTSLLHDVVDSTGTC
jgi:hypothetical protein